MTDLFHSLDSIFSSRISIRSIKSISFFFVTLGLLSLKTIEAQSSIKAQPTSEAAILPSRYVGKDIDAYISKLTSRMAIRTRALGPFGEAQDPDAQPVIKPAIVASTKQRVDPGLPLSELVRMLEITTIMPSEKRFLIGSRSISQGGELPITYRGKQLRIQVTDVTAEKIVFRDLKSGETATRSLNMLPPGMTPGTSSIVAPGIQSPDNDAPIDLEPSP